MSLHKKLLLTFVSVFTIPILVALTIMNLSATQFSKDSTKTLNLRNMQYVGNAADQFFGNIYDFGLYLGTNKDILRYLSLPLEEAYTGDASYAAQNAISTLPYSNAYIRSVAVFRSDESTPLSSGISSLTLSEEERAAALALNGSALWQVEEQSGYVQRICLVRSLRIPQNLTQQIGYVKIELNLEEMRSIMYYTGENAGQQYILATENTSLYFFHLQEDNAFSKLPAHSFFIENSGNSVYSDEVSAYITPYKMSTVPWYLVGLSTDEYTSSLSFALFTTLVVSMLICFVFCLILSFIFSNIITAPLRKMGKMMAQIGNEDFSVRFNAKGKDEVALLARQFNSMSEHLQVLYNQVYKNEISLRDAQIAELQAQINPHF
ncbi:MAG: sensor histidine kinase, partial [Oscillospiraceae bacterium]